MTPVSTGGLTLFPESHFQLHPVNLESSVMHIGRLNQLHDFTQEAVEGLFGSERDRSISEHSQTNTSATRR